MVITNAPRSVAQPHVAESHGASLQGLMMTLARPEADVLDALGTTIVVDQQRAGASPRSTVGTITDSTATLRTPFSRIRQPYVGGSKAFSSDVASISGSGAVTFARDGRRVEERRSPTVTGACVRAARVAARPATST